MDDSDWEPDGTTLHVRFCEGGGPYRSIGMPAATLHAILVVSNGEGPVLSELDDAVEGPLMADPSLMLNESERPRAGILRLRKLPFAGHEFGTEVDISGTRPGMSWALIPITATLIPKIHATARISRW